MPRTKKVVEEAVVTESAVAAPAEKKAAPKKAAAKEQVVETFFEIDGTQVKVEDIVESVKAAYKAEGHRVSSIKSLRTYINLGERKAYYVINDVAENKSVDF